MKFDLYELFDKYQEELSSYYYKDIKIEIGQYWLDTRFKDIIKIVEIIPNGIKYLVYKDSITPYESNTVFLMNFDTLIKSCIYLQSTSCSIYEAKQKYPEYFI